MLRPSTADTCPIANTCQRNLQSAPLCDIAVPDLPALPPAEALCYPALVQTQEYWSRKGKLRGILYQACSNLELALHPLTKQADSDRHFDRSEERLSEVIARGKPDGDFTMHAQGLASQMGIMRLRRYRKLPTVSVLKEHRGSLLQSINMGPEAIDTEHDFSPFYGSALLQQLILRRNRMVYRSTLREARDALDEQPSGSPAQRHPYYVLDGKVQKTPLRQSKTSNAGGPVAKVPFKAIVQKNAQEKAQAIYGRQLLYSELSYIMLTWIRDEVYDSPLSLVQNQILDTLSSDVLYTIAAAKQANAEADSRNRNGATASP